MAWCFCELRGRCSCLEIGLQKRKARGHMKAQNSKRSQATDRIYKEICNWIPPPVTYDCPDDGD